MVTPCACASAGSAMKLIERQQLMQFLMELNDSFQAVMSNILTLNPLPTVSQASSMVLQEEQQREIRTIAPTSVTKSSGLLSHQRSYHLNKSLTQHSISSGYGHLQHNLPVQSQPYSSGSRKPLQHPNPIQCNYCRRPGHTIDKCFRL